MLAARSTGCSTVVQRPHQPTVVVVGGSDLQNRMSDLSAGSTESKSVLSLP